MNIQHRKKIIKQAKQIMIKVGTRLLTDRSRISAIVEQIARLKENKYRVILVSSGAVGMGMKALGFEKRPNKLSEFSDESGNPSYYQ